MRIPIFAKLMIMTILTLLGVAIPIAQIITEHVAETASQREETINLEFAAERAEYVQSTVERLIDKTKVAGAALMRPGEASKSRAPDGDIGFSTDRNFYAIEVRSIDGSVVKRVIKEELLAEVCGQAKTASSSVAVKRRCAIDGVGNLVESSGFPVASVIDGNFEVQNATIGSGPAVFILGIPLAKDESGKITHIALATIDLALLQRNSKQADYRTLFVTDKRGMLLAHNDESRVLARQDFSGSEVVAFAASSPLGKAQKHTRDSYRDSSFYSAFAKTKVGVTVYSESPESEILAPARRAKNLAVLITGLALAIAIAIVYLLSHTLTSPLNKLVGLSDAISKGNFDVHADQQIRSWFRDEVNTLASAFDHMTSGLKERDKVKNLFTKFHGSSVTEDILKGEGGLKGQRKDVLVFFSDIRGFTAYSEKRDPEEIVEMLNEYFAVMVGIINQKGGVVDKFIGDAIMAIWGAPHSTKDDARNAVTACLLMRQGLEELNERRVRTGRPPILIGMGLHSGSAISGTIGSSERMEYTVIGNTVNTTSRIEASTKAFGTDLLITEEVVNRIGDGFWVEYVGSAELKGRSQDIKLFKVRGFRAENGELREVKTPYSQFETEEADKVKVKESA